MKSSLALMMILLFLFYAVEFTRGLSENKIKSPDPEPISDCACNCDRKTDQQCCVKLQAGTKVLSLIMSVHLYFASQHRN